MKLTALGRKGKPGLRVKALLLAGLIGLTTTTALLSVQLLAHRQNQTTLQDLSARALERLADEWVGNGAQSFVTRHAAELTAALQQRDDGRIEHAIDDLFRSLPVIGSSSHVTARKSWHETAPTHPLHRRMCGSTRTCWRRPRQAR